jgi:chromosome segregation ATPase
MIEPPEDREDATEHLWITCPHCHRSNLRIRRANLGHKVYCKHCGKQFRARAGHEPGAINPSSPAIPRKSHASAPAVADRTQGARGEDEYQRVRTALADQAAQCETARRQVAELQDQLAEAQGRLHELQEQLERVQEQLHQAEGLRHELEELRSENGRLRTELKDREEDRLRVTGLADELQALRNDRDRLDAALRAGLAREEQLQARIHEIEEQAGQERDQAESQRRVWQERLESARISLERDLPPLREEVQRLRNQVDALVRERDVALQQLEALGADRDRLTALLEQTEAHGLARTNEPDRDQLTAMAQRNEELAEQARELEAQLNRLQRDREDEAQESRTSQEALRRDLEIALAEATAATDRAAASATARAELEGRLAELEDRLQAADEQSRLLEDELQAQRASVAVQQPESEPGRSLADVDQPRIAQLTVDLDETRAANERLRSLLGVFGLVDHLGAGAGLPSERASSPAALPGRPPTPAPAEGPGSR